MTEKLMENSSFQGTCRVGWRHKQQDEAQIGISGAVYPSPLVPMTRKRVVVQVGQSSHVR